MPRRIDSRLNVHARSMRREPTPFEDRLWRGLRVGRAEGLPFRRQSVIDGRIADFYCPAAMLIVEVDGDTHDREADRRRDQRFAELGYQTIRVTNGDVAGNLEGVLELVLTTARTRLRMTRPPTPSLERKGEQGTNKPPPLREGVGGGWVADNEAPKPKPAPTP